MAQVYLNSVNRTSLELHVKTWTDAQNSVSVS